MKKLLSVCTLIYLFQPAYSQVSTPANNGGVNDYVGWDINQTFPLTIKHEAKQPINFYTDAGSGSLNNLRMFIQGNDGNVGIGNFAPANTLLHLHQSNKDRRVDYQMTDAYTGQSVTDGFRMEYYNSTNYFHITQNELAPIDFYTMGTDGVEQRRLRIYGTDATLPFQKTRVAITTGVVNGGWDLVLGAPISPTRIPQMPAAMLHIGDAATVDNTRAMGYRIWMDYGAYIAGGTDNLYIGMKSEETIYAPDQLINDFADAVISWGDNSLQRDNFNDFRFIFASKDDASSLADPKAKEFDGQEMVRISWNGNMGVGNFYNLATTASSPVRPARRLEVLDGGRQQPQFRLTFEQNGLPVALCQDGLIFRQLI